MARILGPGSSVLLALLARTIAAAQAPGDADLRAALLAEPGQIDRYLELAHYYGRQNRIDDAERLLKEAMSVDPSARRVHDERVRLFAVPFQPRRIGPIAID
jgi:hypothetical protein